MSKLKSLFQSMDRRTFLKILAAIPVLGAVGALGSPIYRVLRPSAGPYDFMKPPDQTASPPQRVAGVSELAEPWSSVDFIYEQLNIEYTARGVQKNKIQGTIIRLPDKYA